MQGYRLYFIVAGRFVRRLDIDAGTDAEAIAAADLAQDGSQMELWLQARMVRSFPADPRKVRRQAA